MDVDFENTSAGRGCTGCEGELAVKECSDPEHGPCVCAVWCHLFIIPRSSSIR